MSTPGRGTAANPFRVNNSADLDRLITFAQQHAPHRAVLFQAVRHGLITLAEITRDGPLPAKNLERSKRPALVLVGDDDGLDCGPNGWAARSRLAGWARHAIIHATGADVPSYALVVAMALQRGRVVLVETGTAHGPAWHQMFSKVGVPTVNLIAPSGGIHPIPVRREGLH